LRGVAFETRFADQGLAPGRLAAETTAVPRSATTSRLTPSGVTEHEVKHATDHSYDNHCLDQESDQANNPAKR